MKTLQFLKHPAVVIIALLMVLSLLLPPAAARVAAQNGGTTTPNLTVDNFKWQDVLGNGWSVDPDMSHAVPYSVGTLYLGVTWNLPLQELSVTFDSLGTKNVLHAEIWWSMDSKGIQALTTWMMASPGVLKSEAKDNPNILQVVHEEGSQGTKQWMVVVQTQGGEPQGTYVVGLNNACIRIRGQIPGSNSVDALVYIFKGLERSAESLLGKGYSIQLVSYNPFGVIPPPYKGGDIVATVTNNGNPVYGQWVYLFVNLQKSDQAFKTCFVLNQEVGGSVSPALFAGSEGVYSEQYFRWLTDKNGQTTCNYLDYHFLDVDTLAMVLAMKHTPVTGVVHAVIFNNDPMAFIASQGKGPVPEVLASEDLTLTFNFTARITKIIYRGPGEATANVTVTQPYWPDELVTMAKVGSEKDPNQPAPELWGYPLFYGDHIIIKQYDEVIVQWLSGVTLGFKARDNWESYKVDQAQVWIGTTDSGVHDRITALANKLGVNVALGALSTGVGLRAVGVAILSKPSFYATVASFVPVAWLAGDNWRNPIAVEAHSQILVDFDNSTTLWTLEGNATVFSTVNQSKVDVTAGHSMQVAPDGTFGNVMTFKKSDLSPDLVGLAQDMQVAESSLAATPSSTQAASGQLPAAGQTQGPPATANTYGGSGSNSKMGEFLRLLAVVATIVVVVLIIGFTLRRRRKVAMVSSQPPTTVDSKPAAPAMPPAPQARPPTAGRFCSRCANQVREDDVHCAKCGTPLLAATPVGTVAEAQSALFCSRCGARAQPGERFCGRCGAGLSVVPETPRTGPPVAMAAAYCPRCGTSNSAGDRFCRKCGSQLVS